MTTTTTPSSSSDGVFLGVSMASERTKMRNRLWVAATVVALGVNCLSGCGNDSDNVGGTGAVSTEGVEAANAYAEQYTGTPDGIDVDTPLAMKPPSDILLVRVTPAATGALHNSDIIKEAVTELGWEYRQIVVGPEPDAVQKAVQSAIQLDPKPDFISILAYPAATWSAQLKEAKDAGIKIVADSITPADPQFDSTIGLKDQQNWGTLLAAATVADSNGEANIAYFTLDLPILKGADDGFLGGIEEWCPACKVETQSVPLTDLGTKSKDLVTSTLQRDPTVDYVIVSTGDILLGLDTGPESSALADNIRIGGLFPGPETMRSIAEPNSRHFAWAGGYPVNMNYRIVDSAARLSVGEEPMDEAPGLYQLFTPDNISEVQTDDAGYPAIPTDGYRTLWNLN